MPLSQWGPTTFTEWLNALTPGPGLSDGSALHYFDASQGHKTPTVGRNGSHTRDSYGWEFDGKTFAERPEHTALHPHLQRRHQDEKPRKGMLFAPAATQLMDHPFELDHADWAASGVTRSDIASLFRGETAQLVSGDSADYIEHEIAGTAAGTRTYVAVVRRRTATSCKFRVWDETAAAYVFSTELNLTTGARTNAGTGTSWARELIPESGAWLVGLKFVQTVAHEIWVEFWPNVGAGTAATEAHHLGVPTGSQTLILSGPANSTGAVDALVHERAMDPQSSVHFLRFQPLSPIIENGVWILAGEAGEYPRLEYVQASDDVGIRYRHDGSTMAESLVGSPVWTEGDDVEVALCLEYDGGDVNVRAGLRINGDDVAAGDVDTITAAQPTAWGGTGAIYLPDPAQPIGLVLDTYKAVKLAELYTPAMEGEMTALLQELSGYTVGDHGDVVRAVRPQQPPLPDPPTAPEISVESVDYFDITF